MDLSVIIVSWNTRDLLRGCLESLPAAVEGLDCEIFVVDNASRDGSAEMVARDFPVVKLLESGGNLGFSRANNLALAHAGGRSVLLLNPDTICPPLSLVRLFSFLNSKPDAAVAGPRLVDGDLRPTISGGWFPRAVHHWLGFFDPGRRWLRGRLADRIVFVPERSEPSRRVEYVMGACFMMTRPALERLGPLDDRFFMYFEETDWCYRARQERLDVWYCAETEITHLEGQAAGAVGEFSLRQFQVSYRAFVAKHYGRRRGLEFRMAQFAEYACKSLLRRLARDPGRAAQHWARARLQLPNRLAATPPA